MKNFIVLTILLSIGSIMYSQQSKEKMIPITTSSESALSLYRQGMKYLDDVNVNKAVETLKKAIKEDPDFFMANYQLAFFYLMNRQNDEFDTYSEAAVNCKARLSEAEKILKDTLVKLKSGSTNFVDSGKKLVEMYPDDPGAYNNLIYFQTLSGDSTGMVETLNKAIKIASDPAPFYNQLGYAYLALKQNDKAETAFDKYIELDPENPNVYDSKGDYFMYVKKYDKAYYSYLKANSMDQSFSRNKAEMAKQLYEQTTGKQLKIISM
jgi:Tfp pilus assembly protein PilF